VRVGTPASGQYEDAKLDEQSEHYFRQREKAEKAAAKHAASEAARRAHQELAAEYAALLRRS
jgi:hypothetical protein